MVVMTNNSRYCIHRSGTYNIHVEYCTCRKKDGCNSAPGSVTVTVTVTVTVENDPNIILVVKLMSTIIKNDERLEIELGVREKNVKNKRQILFPGVGHSWIVLLVGLSLTWVLTLR